MVVRLSRKHPLPGETLRDYVEKACPCCTEQVLREYRERFRIRPDVAHSPNLTALEYALGSLTLSRISAKVRRGKAMHFLQAFTFVVDEFMPNQDLERNSMVVSVLPYLDTAGLRFESATNTARVIRTLLDRYARPSAGLPIAERIGGVAELVTLFGNHRDCGGYQPEEPYFLTDPGTFLDAVHLFVSGEGVFAPCKAWRLARVTNRAAIKVDLVLAFCERYGYGRIDDLVDLLESRTVTREVFVQLAAEPDLFLNIAPTHAELTQLIQSWRRSPHRNLTVYAKLNSPRT